MDLQLHAKAYQEAEAMIRSLREQLAELEVVAAYHKKHAKIPPRKQTSARLAPASPNGSDGRSRFKKMKQRDAARAVLAEANGPLSTAEIATRMTEGGFEADLPTLKRLLFSNLQKAKRTVSSVGPGIWTLKQPKELATSEKKQMQ